MEHLTKQQLILLALLVSFVTSIATGIVSVSLMDQAPVGVTQTINRIVERTIENVSPSQNTGTVVTSVSYEDELAQATEKVSESIVRLKPIQGDSASVSGIGIIISKEGVIVLDKSSVSGLDTFVAVFPDGQEFPIQVIRSQIAGDIAFAVPLIPENKKSGLKIVPMSFARSIKLGQKVFAISGKGSNTLLEGIISKIEGNVGSTTVVSSVSTTIPDTNVLLGSPSFSISGDIVGIKTFSLSDSEKSIFYPLSLVRSTIPKLSH